MKSRMAAALGAAFLLACSGGNDFAATAEPRERQSQDGAAEDRADDAHAEGPAAAEDEGRIDTDDGLPIDPGAGDDEINALDAIGNDVSDHAGEADRHPGDSGAQDGNDADPAGETPPPESDVVHVSLGGCVRQAACALTGTEPGRHHPTLTVANRTFKVGEAIELTYANPTFGAGDWITIVPRDFEDNSWCAWFWAAGAGGVHRFDGLPAGDYELREYYGWKGRGECEVVARVPVTIRD